MKGDAASAHEMTNAMCRHNTGRGRKRAEQFADAVNEAGGHVEILYLPKKGLHGNTHFAFSDLNNLQVADLLSDFLHKNKLDRSQRDSDRDSDADR